MSDDKEGTCSGHGSLATEIEWIKWAMKLGLTMSGGGLLLLLSVIVYFNKTLHTTIITSQESDLFTQALLMESRSQHALGLAKVENKIDSFEILCCEELSINKTKGK